MTTTTDRRAQYVEQVAGILADLVSTDMTGEYDDLTKRAREINEDTGYTFDLSIDERPESWLHCEDISLTDDEINQAVALARRMIDDPGSFLAR